ncbi:MAG: protein-export chaperone SecB, partial [Pseudomonadota bacterium]
MADENPPAGETPAQADGPAEGAQLRVLGQYVKDLSFENPNAPDSLRAGGEAPKIEVSVDVNARRISGDDFEVSLRCSASAQRGESASFIVETVYAGLFQLSGAPDDA